MRYWVRGNGVVWQQTDKDGDDATATSKEKIRNSETLHFLPFSFLLFPFLLPPLPLLLLYLINSSSNMAAKVYVGTLGLI